MLRGACVIVGLAACGKGSPSTQPAAVDIGVPVPRVTAADLPAIDPSAVTIVATPSGIVMDGKALIAIDHGAVDPSEIQGGSLGYALPRLTRFADALAGARAEQGTARDTVQVAIDPSLSYRILEEVVFSTKKSFPRATLLVRTTDGPRAIPIALASPSTNATVSLAEALLAQPAAEQIAAAYTAHPGVVVLGIGGD